jgi:UDP-MurNAc hydroxylase
VVRHTAWIEGPRRIARAIRTPTSHRVTHAGVIVKKSSLTLINHASVLIKGDSQSILTDPWYEGDVFHRGWRLLHENTENDIEQVLNNTNFIWISHEHPDHFSIGFFRKYKPLLIDRKIVILFQNRKDKRVIEFLRKSGFESIELSTGEPFTLEKHFTVRVVKDEFYDSALLVNVAGKNIFNLNDCALHSQERITDFAQTYGQCDVLLTQFSYAAWKGGRDNLQWRSLAAKEKLVSLVRQGHTLKAKTVIPFASFVYFANVLNRYLNDAVNTPQRVIEFCQAANAEFTCVFLKPMESLDLDNAHPKQQKSSLAFWEGAFKANKTYIHYQNSSPTDQLSKLFKNYCERLQKRNSWWLMRLCRYMHIAFRPIAIQLIDTGDVVLVDLANRHIGSTTLKPEVAMHSESLAFIFKFPYGFDTLGVNGTFEELRPGGFSKFAKTLALENLNNLGYSFTLALAFDLKLIAIFIGRLTRASRQLNAGTARTPDVVRAKAA